MNTIDEDVIDISPLKKSQENPNMMDLIKRYPLKEPIEFVNEPPSPWIKQDPDTYTSPSASLH